jgi:hypothetical protein
MGLADDLVKVMRYRMLTAMPPDPTGTVSKKDLWGLVATYATWRRRVPADRPRRVHVSPELLANPVLGQDQNGTKLLSLVREIADGVDLRPRMSIAVEDAYTLPVPAVLERRRDTRDMDRLLADWGVHHLHLNNVRGQHPEFVKRSRHVLFAVFQPDDAYLIDLRDHERDGGDNWSALSILETIVRNWPDAGIMLRSSFATGLTQQWSDDDRRDLRRAGIAGGTAEIDGEVWTARSFGQTITGQPVVAQRHAMKVHWTISELDVQAEIAPYALPREAWTAGVVGDEFGLLNGQTFHSLGSLLPPS